MRKFRISIWIKEDEGYIYLNLYFWVYAQQNFCKSAKIFIMIEYVEELQVKKLLLQMFLNL